MSFSYNLTKTIKNALLFLGNYTYWKGDYLNKIFVPIYDNVILLKKKSKVKYEIGEFKKNTAGENSTLAK
jgi:hypothetical protein